MVKWHLLSALVLIACATQPTVSGVPPQLELIWRVGGLANPESVALARDGSCLYVSNVNGEGAAKDGNDFIARVSSDGRMLQREFSIGLDGPKGVVLRGDRLSVADIDQVVVIDATTGAVRQRLSAPGARFLNDIAVAPDGDVLVADSDTKRIYAVRDGQVSVWLEHDLLRAVNGLLPERDRFIVTTMAGRLLAIDYNTHVITSLAESLGDGDGVGSLGGGRYLVSEWPGLMHVVAPDGSSRIILDTRSENRFLNDFLRVGDRLYQPHWEPSELSAYRIVQARP